MNIYTDDGDFNPEAVLALAKTDPVELAKQLIAEEGVNAFAEGNILFEESGVSGFGIEQVSHENNGDGNEMTAVIAFIFEGVTLSHVRICGTYSSWADSEWDSSDLTAVHLKKVVTEEYIAADGSEDRRYIKVLG